MRIGRRCIPTADREARVSLRAPQRPGCERRPGRTLCALALVLLAGPALAQVRVVPDPRLTPGVVASTDAAEICGREPDGRTYSQDHRRTTQAMKRQVAREYGQARCGEIDHRLELSLGGADAVKNLWCQPGPAQTPWNFRLKDKLEALVWHRVCREHRMSLADGQAVFLAPDWRDAYCTLIGGPPCHGRAP